MVRFVLFGIAVALIATSVGAQTIAETPASSKPAFEFRGHRVGETLPDQAIPANRKGCEKARPTVYTCQDMTDARTTREVGGVPIKMLGYAYDQSDGLFAVHMTFSASDFPAISAMLKSKYGEPDKSKITPYNVNVGGIPSGIEAHTIGWEFSDGLLVVTEMAEGTRTSNLTFGSRAHLAREENAAADALAAKAKTAF